MPSALKDSYGSLSRIHPWRTIAAARFPPTTSGSSSSATRFCNSC